MCPPPCARVIWYDQLLNKAPCQIKHVKENLFELLVCADHVVRISIILQE